MSDAAAKELLDLRDALLERRAHLFGCLKGVRGQIEEINAKLADIAAAGRVFGVVIEFPGCSARPTDSKNNGSLRSLVLRRLDPDTPFYLSAQRSEIEAEYGRAVHAKSLGVALYRLKRDGLAERGNGHDWYLNDGQRLTSAMQGNGR